MEHMSVPNSDASGTTEARLGRLKWEVDELDHLFVILDDMQAQSPVYPQWSAADVLRHLVWWHESFAGIATATLAGTKPDVPSGTLAEVNNRSVEELSKLSVRALRRRLMAAQRLIMDCETLDLRESLPYRRGSRNYTFAERLDIAVTEMRQHRHDVLKAVLTGQLQ
jgi:hypothetical protein